jgi:hypothetical protein
MLWVIHLRGQSEHRRHPREGPRAAPRVPGEPEEDLVLAGATQNDDGTEAIGSCFVVNVGEPRGGQEVLGRRSVHQNGVFKSVTITRMRKGQWNPEAADGGLTDSSPRHTLLLEL